MLFTVMTKSAPHFASQAFFSQETLVFVQLHWVNTSEFHAAHVIPNTVCFYLLFCDVMTAEVMTCSHVSSYLQDLLKEREFKNGFLIKYHCVQKPRTSKGSCVKQNKSSIQAFSVCENDRCVFCV